MVNFIRSGKPALIIAVLCMFACFIFFEFSNYGANYQVGMIKRDVTGDTHDVIGTRSGIMEARSDVMEGRSDVMEGRSDVINKTDIVRTEGNMDNDNDNETKCEKQLPKAILIGSQKSGTGAFFSFLQHHPRLAVSNDPPEFHYFDRKYKEHSLEWYQSQMPCSTPDQITMERTPSYLYKVEIAQRIKKMDKHIKLLVILKDPKEVCGSLYAMWKHYNFTDRHLGKSFEELLTTKNAQGEIEINPNSRVIMLSTYVLHLKKWFDLFDRSQILFLDGTAFEYKPHNELQKVERFLGIENHFTENHFYFNSTKGKYCYTPDGSEIQCLNANKGREHPPMREEFAVKLRKYFNKYDSELRNMTGLKFSWFR